MGFAFFHFTSFSFSFFYVIARKVDRFLNDGTILLYITTSMFEIAWKETLFKLTPSIQLAWKCICLVELAKKALRLKKVECFPLALVASFNADKMYCSPYLYTLWQRSWIDNQEHASKIFKFDLILKQTCVSLVLVVEHCLFGLSGPMIYFCRTTYVH